MNNDEHKLIVWKQPRWEYIPGLWKALREHFSIKRLCFLLPVEFLLLYLVADRENQPIAIDRFAGVLALLSGAIVLHLVLGLLMLLMTCLHWALPTRAATACSVLGLRVGFSYGIGEKDFDRSRIVIFSPTIFRLRAFAGEQSVTTGIAPDVDLEQLIELLPGDTQVWDAMKRERHVIRRDEQSGELVRSSR